MRKKDTCNLCKSSQCSLLIGLSFLVASCSVDRAGMYVSTTERSREIEGTKENYEPRRIHGELENEVNPNLSTIIHSQVGNDDRNFDFSLDAGVKLRYGFLYSKFAGGLGYVTGHFRKQEPKLNVHLLAEIGLYIPMDDCNLSFGRYFDHMSVARNINPFVDKDTKNHGINWKGTKFGMNCKF